MDLLDLAAKITLDDSEFQSGMDKINGALSTLGTVAAAAAGAAAAAMGAFAVKSVQAGMDFDSSMSQVAATMGYSVSELNDETSDASKTMEELRAFAEQMGASTAFSATEAADALNYMALAGYDAETSMEMLPNVLNLAAAGGMELADASDMITDAQTALGLSLDETSDMVDQMAAASSNTNTSVSQLGDAFLTIGANARSLSGGTAELSQNLGILADNGIKGSEAGTHLRNIILALNPSTDEAAQAWEDLGVSAYNTDGTLRPLEDTFQDLSAAMEGMTDQEKTNTISAMFNKTDLASVNALLGTSAERWNEVAEAIDSSEGAAEDMANVQLDNLSGDITLFQSALEGAEIAVSDALTPTLREFVQLGTTGLSNITTFLNNGDIGRATATIANIADQALQKINDLMPTVLTMGGKIIETVMSGIVRGIPSLINTSAEIINTLAKGISSNASDVVNMAANIISALGNAFVTLAPTLMSAASQLMLSLVQGISEHSQDIVDGAVTIVETLGSAILENAPLLVETISTLSTTLMEIGSGLIQSLVQGITEHGQEFVTMAGEIMTTIASAILEAIPALLGAGAQIIQSLAQGARENVSSFLETALPMIMNFTTELLANADLLIQAGLELITQLALGLIDALPTIIETVPTIVANIADIINDNAPLVLATGVKLIVALVQGLIQAIPTIIANIPQIINAIVSVISAFNWINLGSKIITGIKNGILAMKASITQGMKTSTSDALAYLKTLPGHVLETGKSIGKNIINGIINGVKSMASSLTGTIGDVISNAITAAKSILGIASPSKVFAEMGRYMSLGLEKGWTEEFPNAQKAITDGLSFSASEIPTVSAESVRTSENGQMAGQAGDTQTTVVVRLEGDAQRLFRVMQEQSRQYKTTTGKTAFA